MRRVRGTIVASLGLSLALCGCDVSLPHIVTTSVEQARAEAASALVPQVEVGLKRAGTLTVGIQTGSQAPYVSERAQGRVGLDVELAGALANELGLPVTYVEVSGDVVEALTTTCDCVMGVRADEAAGFEVGCAYASAAVGVFSATGEQASDASALGGRTLAVQTGSAAQQRLRTSGIPYTELEVASLAEVLAALRQGNADFGFGSVAAISYLARMSSDVTLVATLDAPVAVGVAYPGGDDVVSAAIREAFSRLEGDGVLLECRRRWVADLAVLGPEAQMTGLVESQETTESALEVVEDSYGGGTYAGSNAVTLR